MGSLRSWSLTNGAKKEREQLESKQKRETNEVEYCSGRRAGPYPRLFHSSSSSCRRKEPATRNTEHGKARHVRAFSMLRVRLGALHVAQGHRAQQSVCRHQQPLTQNINFDCMHRSTVYLNGIPGEHSIPRLFLLMPPSPPPLPTRSQLAACTRLRPSSTRHSVSGALQEDKERGGTYATEEAAQGATISCAGTVPGDPAAAATPSGAKPQMAPAVPVCASAFRACAAATYAVVETAAPSLPRVRLRVLKSVTGSRFFSSALSPPPRTEKEIGSIDELGDSAQKVDVS